jgi:hypothetical protein
MTGEIVFKEETGEPREIKWTGGFVRDARLTNREGEEVSVFERVRPFGEKPPGVVVFIGDQREGMISSICNETVIGEDLGFPYVESITHIPLGKER